MSPIEITAPTASEVADDEVDVESILYNEDKSLTLEGEVVSEFLNFVQWDEVFDDPEMAEHIKRVDAFILPTEDGEDFAEVEEGTKDAEKVKLEQIDGEILAQVIDEDDLLVMFEYYLKSLPETTLEDKARKAVFGALDVDEEDLDELMHGGKKKKKKKMGMTYEGDDGEDVDEAGAMFQMMLKKKGKKKSMHKYEDEDGLDEGPFKKGSFRKIHKAGGKDLVARMLIAMLSKEAVRRAPGGPGTGYKGGDYKKAKGYAPGTASGQKRYRAYVRKHKAAIEKTKKATKKASKIGKRFAAKAKVKKGVKAKKKKKKLAASAPAPSTPVLSEGAALASKVVAVQTPKLEEDKKSAAS